MPYETVDEAINIANGTRYGLGASVFGPDQPQALKVAKQLECGMVSVNDFAVFYVSIFMLLNLISTLRPIYHIRSSTSYAPQCLCTITEVFIAKTCHSAVQKLVVTGDSVAQKVFAP